MSSKPLHYHVTNDPMFAVNTITVYRRRRPVLDYRPRLPAPG